MNTKAQKIHNRTFADFLNLSLEIQREIRKIKAIQRRLEQSRTRIKKLNDNITKYYLEKKN